MTTYAALRTLIGGKKFDSMVGALKRGRRHEAARPAGLASMSAEPENSGLSIPDGRKALKKASKRVFSLPDMGSPG